MNDKSRSPHLACRRRIALATPSSKRPSAEDRLKDLYQRNIEFLRQTLRRRGALDGDIDDLTQRVFYTAYMKLDSIQEGSERAFLRRVAFYELGHLWRSARRRSEIGDEDVELLTTESTRQDELIARRRAHSSAGHVLARMTRELGDVFRLHAIEGHTNREIAECLELPLGTVKTRLRKARRLFSDTLVPPSSA